MQAQRDRAVVVGIEIRVQMTHAFCLHASGFIDRVRDWSPPFSHLPPPRTHTHPIHQTKKKQLRAKGVTLDAAKLQEYNTLKSQARLQFIYIYKYI